MGVDRAFVGVDQRFVGVDQPFAGTAARRVCLRQIDGEKREKDILSNTSCHGDSELLSCSLSLSVSQPLFLSRSLARLLARSFFSPLLSPVEDNSSVVTPLSVSDINNGMQSSAS